MGLRPPYSFRPWAHVARVSSPLRGWCDDVRSRDCDGDVMSLSIGDLVPIYKTRRRQIDRRVGDVNIGILTEMVGYKTTVLVNGELESWDLSDLKKMASWKMQDDRVDAARQNESR